MTLQVLDASNYAFNTYAIPTFLTTAAAFILGLLVLVRERDLLVSLLFFFFTLFCSIWLFSVSWMYCSTTEPVALWWAKAAHFGVVCIPSVVYQFSLAVLRIDQRHKKFVWFNWVVSGLFCVAVLKTDALIGGLYHYGWGYYPKYGPLGIPLITFFFWIMIVTLRNFWIEYRNADPGTVHKLRTKSFMIAFAIVYIGSFDYFAVYGFPVYPFGYIPVLGFLVMAAQTIWRYHLVDIASAFTAKQVLNTMQGAVFVVDLQGKVRVVNPAACAMLGYQESELIDKIMTKFVSPPDQITRSAVSPAQDRAIHNHAMIWNSRDGRQIDVLVSASGVVDEHGIPLGLVYVAQDISEQKKAEAKIQHMAFYDTLTKLPNRNMLYDRLLKAIQTASGQGKPMALLLMDLDHFKEINDTLGHYQGDLLLKEMGSRLKSALFEPDTVARLGGDEFTVLLPRLAKVEDIHVVIQKLQDALRAPFMIDSQPVAVEASIGVAIYPDHGTNADVLLQRADVAMYMAKNSGSGYLIYDPKHDEHSPRRLALIGELRQAIDNEQLFLYYQPKISFKTHRVIGLEALVRWQHPEYGFVPPDQFILPAEQTGLIHPLTRWVLKTALSQSQVWRQAGLDLPVSVNLSARNLHDPELRGYLAELFKTTGGTPELLELEITESAIMADPQRALEVITRLRAMGIRFSLDDFGIGYSSLSYLKKLPVDTIKIDKSFVMDMAKDEDDVLIVLSTINLAHNLGLKVVAEGVELGKIWDQLANFGCDAAQGYYMSKPLPVDDLNRWLKESPWGIK